MIPAEYLPSGTMSNSDCYVNALSKLKIHTW